MPGVTSFTFGTHTIDVARSTVSFTYHVTFKYGLAKTFTDRLYFKDVPKEAWATVPPDILETTLQSLLLMLGINYWCTFRTKNIRIESFKPLDCVGVAEEMILAMHYVVERGEYVGEPAIKIFKEHFPASYDFTAIERQLLENDQ